jgi:hypothetical protein
MDASTGQHDCERASSPKDSIKYSSMNQSPLKKGETAAREEAFRT